MSDAPIPNDTPAAQPQDWLDVVTLGPLAPVETKFDVDTPLAPDGLHTHLFEPIAPDAAEIAAWEGAEIPKAATYAILDASALTLLPEMLEASELDHNAFSRAKRWKNLTKRRRGWSSWTQSSNSPNT